MRIKISTATGARCYHIRSDEAIREFGLCFRKLHASGINNTHYFNSKQMQSARRHDFFMDADKQELLTTKTYKQRMGGLNGLWPIQLKHRVEHGPPMFWGPKPPNFNDGGPKT